MTQWILKLPCKIGEQITIREKGKTMTYTVKRFIIGEDDIWAIANNPDHCPADEDKIMKLSITDNEKAFEDRKEK